MITKQGIITSAKMTNTVTVTVHRHAVHPLYKKQYRLSKKFLADTNNQQVGVGDEVIITECRPLSKTKHFKVTEIVKKAEKLAEMKDDAELEAVMHRTKATDAVDEGDAKKNKKSSVPSAK